MPSLQPLQHPCRLLTSVADATPASSVSIELAGPLESTATLPTDSHVAGKPEVVQTMPM